MKLSLDDLAHATGGTLYGASSVPRAVRVVTDTRSLEAGDVFLALHGERFNGHDYLAEAITKGVVAVVVDDRHEQYKDCATLCVKDTLRAYMDIATLARSRFAGKVIAITGSAGKTTTKTLLAQLLQIKYGDRVIAAPANENNEIGVSKLLLNVDPARHDVVVVEMGARHYGDIRALVDVAQPDVGVLTNIGDAHLEIMGSRERLEETKWQLFGNGARAILNARDRASVARAPSLAQRAHWFFAGDEEDTVPFSGWVTAVVGDRHVYEIDHGVTRILETQIRLPGAHNRANLAAAIAGATELGVDLEAIAAAIPDLHLPEGRYERINLQNDSYLIYDAYNANAAGMLAALDAFAGEHAKRRIAVLSSMAELGEAAADLHRRVGARAAKNKVDVLLVGGEFASELSMGAIREGLSSERIVPFMTNSQAAQWLRTNARSGDAILLKGSRKYHLEEIVAELRS